MLLNYLRENSQYTINIELADGDKTATTLSEFIKSDTFKKYNKYAYDKAVQFSDDALNKFGVWKSQHGGVSIEKLSNAFDNIALNSFINIYLNVFEGTLKPSVFDTFFNNCLSKVLETIDELFTDKDPEIAKFLKNYTKNGKMKWKAVKIVLNATFRSPFRHILKDLGFDFLDPQISPFTTQVKKLSSKMINEFEKNLINYKVIENSEDYIVKQNLNDLIEIFSELEFNINDFVNKDGKDK